MSELIYIRRNHACISIFLLIIISSIIQAVPMYSQREGVSCIYCHTSPNVKRLNDVGLLYGRNGHYFPYQFKPKISQQFPDSKSDPAYLKLKQRYMKKYFKRDPINEYIERGKRLFFGSFKLEKKSAKTCASCHTPKEIAQVNRNYPRYVPLMKKVVSLEQMQNYCLVQYLSGKAIEPGSKDALSIAAYLNSISSQKK
ncbi:MAG: hypothetical protein VX619_03540 [bacterium]|nr:hypothetical protein [bacterium]